MPDIKRIFPDIFDPEPGIDPVRTAAANVLHKRLYLAVRYLLKVNNGIGTKDNPPVEPSSFPKDLPPEGDPTRVDASMAEVRMAAIYGQLLLSGFDDPSLGRLDRGSRSDEDTFLNGWNHPGPSIPAGTESFGNEPDGITPFRVLIVREFKQRFNEAATRFFTNQDLYFQVWVQLRDEGRGKINGVPTQTIIRAKQIAEVTERLITDGVSPSDPHIVRKVLNAISQSLGGIVDAHPSALDVSLPDLDAGTSVEILADNVQAVRVIYYSAMLEEMKMHAVLEKMVEHFQTGMLPITRGAAADKVWTWIKQTQDRLTEMERRGIYGRILGHAQGATNEGTPNREFSDLWYKFVATVSLKYREIYSTEKNEVSAEQVHKSARDLAVNISLHGYGIAWPAAIEMQQIVKDVISILDEPQTLTAYGVRDRWQLVDRVSALYLGGAVNGVKYRTMANSGEKIIKWLADNAAMLASGSPSSLKIIDPITGKATPSFEALAQLAESWLAVTGTSDDTIRRNTDPVDLQTQYTVPMLGESNGVPSAVQDALNQVGAGIPNLPVIPPN